MIETKAAFSRRLGVNKSTVTRMAKAGRLVLTESGKVKVEESLAQINATQGHRTDVSQRHAQNRGHALNNATQAQQSATGDDLNAAMAQSEPTSQPANNERTALQAAALDFKNKSLKLEEALNRGIRLDKDEYHSDLAKQGGNIKSAIERLIDNLAPQLTGLSKDDRQQKIQQQVSVLLEQI